VFDISHEVANRLLPFAGNSRSSSLDENIVVDLLKMLDETNEIAKLFRKARDKTQNIQSINFILRLLGKRDHDSRQYDDPTSNDIGGLVDGDIWDFFSERDIIIECFSGSLKRISYCIQNLWHCSIPLCFFTVKMATPVILCLLTIDMEKQGKGQEF